MTTTTKQLDCILLVDDSDFTNIFNRRLLTKYNVAKNIETAKDGKSALDYLIEAENDPKKPKPDLILLDINMPIMDGWEFLTEFSKKAEFFKGIKIVMLTTSPNPMDEQKARSITEVDDYYIKPISKELITEIIDKHF